MLESPPDLVLNALIRRCIYECVPSCTHICCMKYALKNVVVYGLTSYWLGQRRVCVCEGMHFRGIMIDLN